MGAERREERGQTGGPPVNLLLLGPQGSGKGTQAARIAAEYGIPHVSTGDMFRAAIAAGTRARPRGRADPTTRGELVPDELTIELIEERLAEDDAREGFVLDGFPRNLAQAEALDAMLSAIGRDLDAMLFFDLPDDVAARAHAAAPRQEGRDRRHARGDRAAARHLPRRRPSRSSSTTARPASSCRCTPTRTMNEVFAEIQHALDQVAAR